MGNLQSTKEHIVRREEGIYHLIYQRISMKFNLLVTASTMYTMITEERDRISRQGSNDVVSADHTKIVSHAIQTYIVILQINGGNEVQNKDVIALLTNSGSTIINPISPHKMWDRVRVTNPCSFSIAIARIMELQRQQWTTFCNLNLWFDQWKTFLVEKGFVTLDAPLR